MIKEAVTPTPLRLSEKEGKVIRARFDVAQTNDDNARHWGAADGMSADAAYSQGVRKTIRQRARLELENNSYARGIVWTKVNDVIGSGPRLQMQTGDDRFDERFEKAWEQHVRKINLVRKLKAAYKAKIVDGEGFLVISNNPGLSGPIRLDLMPIECDRVANPASISLYQDKTDGITLDAWGNPTAYSVLVNHPGDLESWNLSANTIAAQYMIHLFRMDRPEQHRGVSELAASLPLFADLRRYTSAVVAAAETAADFAMVLESTGPASEIANLEPLDKIELQKRLMTTLPEGWGLNQVKAEQPTTGYGDFKYQIVSEIARCLNVPYIIAALDSSKSNFASAKLDNRTYEREITTEHGELEASLNRFLEMFAIETSRLPGMRKAADVVGDHIWMWEGPPEVDPREAGATQVKLDSMQTTLMEVYAKRGKDWMRHGVLQTAREQKAIKKYLTVKETDKVKEDQDEPDDDQRESQ